jgi:iron complex outermembrane recepter protein
MNASGRKLIRHAVHAMCGLLLAGTAQWARADEPTSQPATQPTTQPAAQVPVPSGEGGFTDKSLEDLMNVEVKVYSVSKHAQTLLDAPAAVTVIGQDDIRRSGMNTIPEMLRMVPGLDVARINSNQWAISSRGFNELYANKLLVLMDGRSVYTPLFSGVYWDTLDYVLPDLDRIEVIRGPGATLWGANAVNGVINITTKSAKDTQGFLVDGIGGNETQQGSVRYGGQIDDNTFFRVYGKYRHFENFEDTADLDHDGWQDLRSGFRVDHFVGKNDTLTFQGDVYGDRTGQTILAPVLAPPFRQPRFVENDFSGGNLLGRWTHTISATSDLSVQFYYDRLNRPDAELGYSLDTFDLDVQHRFALSDRQEVIYGADFRFMMDHIKNTDLGTFDPTSRDDYLVSGFIQDDITLIPDRLHFMAGTKLEQNSYSGFEIQPSGRLLYTPNDRNAVWGAVSRAVRTPSRWEQDSRIVFNTMPTQAGIPGEIDTIGQKNFDSEQMTAYEIGYRVRPASNLTFDTAFFYDSYDKIRSGTAGAPSVVPTPTPHLVIPVTLGNDINGEAFGAELAATWKVTSQWRLSGSYSWLDLQLHRGKGVDPTLERTFEGTSPHNQFQLHSYLDITKNLELNTGLYYVEALRTGDIPTNVRVDANVTWRPKENLSLTVGVQNLFDNQHPEFNSGLFVTRTTEIPRTYFAELSYRF